MREAAVSFGPNASLVGIITSPSVPAARRELPGVILLNAGIINRVGPNRIYVKMARRLADMGLPVLRFDFSGRGYHN